MHECPSGHESSLQLGSTLVRLEPRWRNLRERQRKRSADLARAMRTSAPDMGHACPGPESPTRRVIQNMRELSTAFNSWCEEGPEFARAQLSCLCDVCTHTLCSGQERETLRDTELLKRPQFGLLLVVSNGQEQSCAVPLALNTFFCVSRNLLLIAPHLLERLPR